MCRVILGKEKEIWEVMTAILANGHILLEDIPGVGKTTLAAAFSRVLGLDYRRIQFTPDVMPSDLTGFSIYRREEERFVYQPGCVFCNLLLADEINRTSPKTQSALLEVMEERRVTVEGVTSERAGAGEGRRGRGTDDSGQPRAGSGKKEERAQEGPSPW